jgi:2-polyprenyl-6-methoxyphenol hydroxylase-like FAD-dependent oxidoreductase
MSPATILISGAGIAGPTIAYRLLKRGFTPILVERAPRFREGGYIIDFWAVGFGVAERMGLIPPLREVGYSINQVEFVTREGKRRSALGRKVLNRAFGDRFLSLQRGDLAKVIYRTIANDVETSFGDSIVAIRQGAGGVGYYAASFITPDYPKRDEHAYLSYAAPGRQISRYALGGNRTAFFFVFESQNLISDSARNLAEQKRILKEIFSRESWIEWAKIERRLDACDDLYFDAVSQITLPCWSQDRTVLIGDAAYCPSLLAGEGAAFAMAGAYILATELERAGEDYTRAFGQYEQCFRPFIERKQKLPRSFAASLALKTRLGLFVRDQIIPLTAVPLVADFLMQRFVADRFVLPD